ncbi:MAG: hypothetical protein LBH77_06985 [Tannerella sp.]|nr:hypothetical protein [Tannerella sp.]
MKIIAKIRGKKNFFIIFSLKNFSDQFIIALFVAENKQNKLKINTMNTLMKSLGIVILLIGVGLLAFAAFTSLRSNVILGTGLAAVIVGFAAHIFLNKKFE